MHATLNTNYTEIVESIGVACFLLVVALFLAGTVDYEIRRWSKLHKPTAAPRSAPLPKPTSYGPLP